MRKLLITIVLLLTSLFSFAQKVTYKDGLIQVDEKDLAKVVKIKDKGNFGLTSSYELYSMSGEKLVIATLATDFAEARNDNSSYYYRFTFLTTNQLGIFTLGKLSTEKSFAKLIGENGIVAGDQLDPGKVAELIALKGRNPSVKVVYNLVNRNRMMAVTVKENQVSQGLDVIGQFKDISRRPDLDNYEFSLPSGLVVASVYFTGGNASRNFTVTTFKTAQTQIVTLSHENGTFGQAMVKSEGVDRNQEVLKEIAKWLVKNDYL